MVSSPPPPHANPCAEASYIILMMLYKIEEPTQLHFRVHKF